MFISKYSFLLDPCNTLSSSSIILGDINVYFDIPTNPLVRKINSQLNRYNSAMAGPKPGRERRRGGHWDSTPTP